MKKQSLSDTGKRFEEATVFFEDNGYKIKSDKMHYYTLFFLKESVTIRFEDVVGIIKLAEEMGCLFSDTEAEEVK